MPRTSVENDPLTSGGGFGRTGTLGNVQFCPEIFLRGNKFVWGGWNSGNDNEEEDHDIMRLGTKKKKTHSGHNRKSMGDHMSA